MNFNVWNIKEMMSIPSGSGTIKSSNRNNNQTDCSALSDSQFLFGSQFCPENSESISAPLDLGPHLRNPKQTQQNSMDNEPSIFTKYQTKPQLFKDDTKDEGSSTFSLPLPVVKPKGLLRQFEEKKKWATDKSDSETLYALITQVGESIHRLQTSVEQSEEHLHSRSQTLLESLKNMTNTLHDTTRVQKNLMCESVQDKGNRDQAILEIQKKIQNRQEDFAEVKAIIKHLEVVIVQQSKDLQQLSEQLSQVNVPCVVHELKDWISALQEPRNVKDVISQTSPLSQSLDFSRKETQISQDLMSWQAQTLPTSGKTSMGSLRPGELGVWDEGAKTNALQEDGVLPAVESREGNGHMKNKRSPNDYRNQADDKMSPKNQISGVPGYKICEDRALVSEGTSQLFSKDVTTSAKNASTEDQAQNMLSCDPGEQLATEQKGRMIGRRKKGKKPRKARRVRRPVRKQEKNPSDSKHQSPVSSPQGLPRGQQEPQAQPLRQSFRRFPKAVCYDLRGPFNEDERARATRSTSHASQDMELLFSSSLEDHQIGWFNSLSDRNPDPSPPPLSKKKKRTLLRDLGLDSSDDNDNPQ
ncbi:interactor of HORMAD1 protein 1 [Thomomys bottae]